MASVISKRLKELRVKEGLTQSEFAKRIEVSQPMFAYWENDSKPISSEAVKKICRVFKIDSSYFYSAPSMGDDELNSMIADFKSLSRSEQDIITAIIKKFSLLKRLSAK